MVSISDKSELGRTKVSIDYDGEDFVIAFQSENFRHLSRQRPRSDAKSLSFLDIECRFGPATLP